MTRKRMFPTLSVAAACALGAAPIASASAATDVQKATSGNWSGYVVGASSGAAASSGGASGSGATTFKSVTGSWVQPTARCSSGGATYSAFWVGLGGADGRQALEQDGTEANCNADGTANYYAWYELVPKAPVRVDLAVHPGDHMTATTTVDGHDVTETIVNHTTGRSFSRTLTMSNPDVSTAEWIAEAPSQCQTGAANCTALPLSDFGKVSFTSAGATDSSGHTGTISSTDWATAAVALDSSSSSAGSIGDGYGYGQPVSSSAASGSAAPSGLTNGGSAFTVTYARAASASSGAGAGSGSSYGYGGGSGDGYGSSGGYGYPGGSGAGYGYGYGYGYGGSSGYGYPDGYGYSTGGDGQGGYIVIYGY
ncbi:MAG: G1 family glutamic endopeptidase [Solirubrobacteraceae bacterium]